MISVVSFAAITLVASIIPFSAQAQEIKGQWLMKGFDQRRTGQSDVNGPAAIDFERSWTTQAPAAFVLNVGASVDEHGVYFGSWGLTRRDPQDRDRRFWDKFDGKIFGHAIEEGAPLWGGPLDLDITHQCYELEGREKRGEDIVFCGAFNPWLATFYNGTVEGQAAIDTARNVMYVGRGDGKLYAIDTQSGAILWRFVTFNPRDPDDPDGGGEVIGAPLIGDDGTVYFGTWGVGPYETNAVYAVDPEGNMLWRFPRDSSITEGPLFASPALSPDGATIYFGSFFNGDLETPALLLALDVTAPPETDDNQRLKWQTALRRGDQPAWTTTLAVGSDGALFVGGLIVDGFANVPVVFAIREVPDPKHVILQYFWEDGAVELRDGAQWIGGIALREIEGQTRRLYASTANFRSANANENGALYAIEPATGAVLDAYDPSDDVPAAVGGLNSPAIGADGTVYVGVRGKYEAPNVEAVNGQVFAVRYDNVAAEFTRLWNFEVDGHIEWNHPSIGPDGGLYIGSSVGGATPFEDFAPGEVPPNTTCTFYAIKGPQGPVAVEDNMQRNGYRLEPIFPNPLHGAATIAYRLPHTSRVRLTVEDFLGRTLRVLQAERHDAGYHRVLWDGLDDRGAAVPAGAYIIRLTSYDDRSGGLTVVTQRVVYAP